MDNPNDIETLRDELIDLSEKGYIKQTKSYLKNKRRSTPSVLKRIKDEYIKDRDDVNKQKMAINFVMLAVSISDTFCYKYFTINERQKFIEKTLGDENIMFVIRDLMPSYTPDDYYSKYLLASISVGTLCYNHISVVTVEEKQSEATSTESEPGKQE